MILSLRLSESDVILIKKFANLKGMTTSQFVRQTVIERIEDEIDLETYNKVIAEHKADPVTYSLEEMERDLGL